LYHPPTVHGWPGGRHWINTATMTARSNLALALLQGSGPYGEKLNPCPIAQKHGASDLQSAGRFLFDLFLQGDVEGDEYDTLLKAAEAPAGGLQEQLRRFAYSVTTLAEFNLA
ncbi:MAG TPA: DUF1800 family protein, partial [Sedimentisphaerales bacterium]|nr:DUF1800 family protein [Sedimentisphaerales bacterium]